MVLRKVALTGCSGMTGRHVMERLAATGVTAAMTSRERPAVLMNGFSWSPWDLTEWKTKEELDQFFPDVQALLHVGAMIPDDKTKLWADSIFDANVRASLCLGEWALKRGIPVVYLSGAIVYAQPERAGIQESDFKASQGFSGNFYGFSKLLAEEVLTYCAGRGLRLIILRASSIYGAGLKKGKMISNFLSQASENNMIKLIPPAEDKIDLIHAADVAESMVQALEKEAWGTYNIASESPKTVMEIAQTCVRVVGKGKVAVSSAKTDRDPIVRFGLSCDKARKVFGFKPKINLKQGIERIWQAVQSHVTI